MDVLKSLIKNKSTKWWLIVIIVLSFIIPLIYSFAYRILPSVDAKAYDAIAQNIVAGVGFREAATGDILFDRSIQRAGPAYEYFLAGIYSIFGRSLAAVWIIQAFMHALSAWLIYCLAKLLFKDKGKEIGLIGAGLFGLHPDLIEISAMLMTETFYLFFVVLVTYLFVRVWQKPSSYGLAFLLGLTTGVGILSRPPLLLFIPAFLLLYLTRKHFLQAVLMVVVVVVVMTPWAGRNYKIYNQFIPTTLIGEYNIWIGNTLQADGGQLAGGYNPFDEHASEYGYTTIAAAAKQSFKSFLIEHPATFTKLTATRTVRYFSLIRPMGFWFYQTGAAQLVFVATSALAIAVLFTSGLIGTLLLWQKRKALFYYLLYFAATSPLVLLPTVVQSRYRFQVYPYLALFGGYAILHLVLNKKRWKEKTVWIPLLFLTVVSLIDVLMNVGKILGRFSGLLKF